jgi:hypothetical protein
MKNSIKLIIAWAGLTLALAPSAFAQTTAGSILYTPNVDLRTLSQNSFVGTVGGIFLTTYSYYPQVNYVGYADPTGAPLANSHLPPCRPETPPRLSMVIAGCNSHPL